MANMQSIFSVPEGWTLEEFEKELPYLGYVAGSDPYNMEYVFWEGDEYEEDEEEW